ncbi:tRNA (adenosine(37)-N6)-threonylcarbamoyltransferase complex dimerization subunit type 1 TsaB [Acetilactobacillus jinshanensis]|uniref:tRNA (Adenosine(37)-N6)-threonylcarbamoyltransferase complex dimerization subunit type 1 TsaB n=1 Tax=Acetilactobacillus jinshanensis TaxID=1720083 RepID=A0A4P6ZMJ8_9LACO|nr:tRNA (adenosine(37)-N6)-threonylcarbamoyltransferase complex dimerization subunit type 1 TsaB [Acetilactobacillus jinshanensis]QBP18827.1 tRNA (adenosine(37)-N6)-threonylcarbamoyltransferase complex dimerization subunit type 1 TsaB [Acetilactobacillus jinshanensis]URL61694.1 tRNA (adenosine(37)-N6)-threonylcarbamoyltransferase complex dimerization subunit type 1 TsaB [uncultured bacterium]
MEVLALDTSNRPLSVAVLEDHRILSTMTTTVNRMHSKELLPIIKRLMSHSGLEPEDLTRVVVASGPGSYTGVRIACTTAKVLAFCLGIDLVSVSSLKTLALNLSADEGALVNPVFDARNENMYTGLYRIKNHMPVPVIKDQHIPLVNWLAELKKIKEPIIGIGDADHFKAQYQKALGKQIDFAIGMDNLPQASALGRYGETQKPVKDVNAFLPNYLRLTPVQARWLKKHPNASRKPGNYVDMYRAEI